MGLIEALKTVPDPRAQRGKRHPLWLALLIIIMGAMLGYWGYRPLAEFIDIYGDTLRHRLKLSQAVEFPSYSTLRRIMQALDFVALAEVFAHWAQQYAPLEPGAVLAVDGKSIKSTLSNYEQQTQNFVSLVSLFSHERGFVYHCQALENAHTSEQQVVQQLLETLALHPVVVTMDALHAQKNP